MYEHNWSNIIANSAVLKIEIEIATQYYELTTMKK